MTGDKTDVTALVKYAQSLEAENARLRSGLAAIAAATVDGRVCDDVAWFDGITTLYDYIDQALNGNGQVVAAAHEQRGTAATATDPGSAGLHYYLPSIEHRGDCVVCGHVESASVHKR